MSTPKAGRLVRVGLYDLTPGYLGKGNFAIVRLGIHRLTKTSVAVKIVEKSDLDEENLQKISREIEIMRRLNHPSIIRLFQVMETEAMIYIVTEFASKGDIFDHLVKNGKMSETEACHVFAQILSAVKYCHTRGVVHRDLKVENLLLDGESNIKLADFGFSNYYESETSLLSTWCGSPPYAAPELFEGKKYVGPKVDMWSLGVVLYVLVSGTLPFDGPTLMDLRERVVKCQYRVPFFLSQECEQLLKGLLVIEPEKRFSIDTVVTHPWTVKYAAPITKSLLEQVLYIKDLNYIQNINEATVETIVRSVNIDRETVIEAVRQNKCDDICAMYHMVEYNIRDRERERLQTMVTMLPPSSPTSKSPFFNMPSSSQQHVDVTEVYNSYDVSLLMGASEPGRNLKTRRHTLGPGQPPSHIAPPRQNLIIPGHQHGRATGILPQTNLTQNLPLVSNLPPESFCVKNPHLLKPPPTLQGSASMGRRASDGGGVYFSLFTKEEAAHLASFQALYNSACEESQKQQDSNSTASSTNESPRRRRTGLLTVMEKPPEINPELQAEVENRMRSQAVISPTCNNNGGNPSTQPTPPPKTSPNKHASLRARRTGLSTVLETKAADCLNPLQNFCTSERISPVLRRASDCNSSDASPCADGFQAMQEEAAAARLAQNEGASSADSASSGYMSPHFLRPPSPDELHMQPRRSSDSGVDMPGGHHHEISLRNSASVPSQPIQQLYDEMYMDPSSPAVSMNNSRRYSYPNSPVHSQISSSVSSTASTLSHYYPAPDLRTGGHPSPQLDQRLQQLKLQHNKIDEEDHGPVPTVTVETTAPTPASSAAAGPPRSPLAWKGSITQGVPASATSPTPQAASVMSSLGLQPPSTMAHSCSFDEATAGGRHLQNPNHGLVGISGSATNLWTMSNMEDSEVDYMSLPFTPSTTPRPSVTFSDCNNPEICVTNVTGDEIKFVFGSTPTQPVVAEQPQVEPMDHS